VKREKVIRIMRKGCSLLVATALTVVACTPSEEASRTIGTAGASAGTAAATTSQAATTTHAQVTITSEAPQDDVTTVSGVIDSDTVWDGDVLVVDSVTVQPGVTLTIAPGTRVMFEHYRGYRDPGRRLSLTADRATVIAGGTPEAPIYFTSDAPDPQNGDWAMVVLRDSADSVFRYCVFEFALQGLNAWHSAPVIDHCVVRWHNWEGLYFESYSHPVITHTSIYQNGYNGIAAEQFNDLRLERVVIADSGTSGLHLDASSAVVLDSLFTGNRAGGLSVDNSGSLRAEGVVVEENGLGVMTGEGSNEVLLANTTAVGNRDCDICTEYEEIASDVTFSGRPEVGFEPDMSHALGYTPGNEQLDRYPYIYPDEDETRRVVRKLGANLGLTWALAWDGEAIWAATPWAAYYRLDPETGETLQQFEGPGSQPWGLAWDGSTLWMVDFAEKALYRIDPADGSVLARYPTPDPTGGCKGLAWDGEYLYVLGWATHVIFKMDRAGNLVETVELRADGMGGLAWDGEYFWMPGGPGIIKVDPEGNQVGWIYPASEGTWDLAWGDGLLWASQRTNENWMDSKIYAIEILDDHS
jgi:hypothetical protein